MSMNITRNQSPSFSANYYLKACQSKEAILSANDIATAKELLVKRCKHLQTDMMLEKHFGEAAKKENPSLPDRAFPGFKFQEVNEGVKISITNENAKTPEGAREVEFHMVNGLTKNLVPHRHLEENIFVEPNSCKPKFEPLNDKAEYEIPVQAPSLQVRTYLGRYINPDKKANPFKD